MAIIETKEAPGAIGPYSQAIRKGSTIYTSGQLGLNPDGMDFAGPDIAAQARQALLNVQKIIEAAGGTLADVVKTTCFLSDMDNFAAFNKIYGEFFAAEPPARSCVEASRLPKDALVEIEAVAVLAE